MRAGNQRILAQGDVAAAVAAEVRHDGPAFVSLAAGRAARDGSGRGAGSGTGGDLVFFARHGVVKCASCLRRGWLLGGEEAVCVGDGVAGVDDGSWKERK